jgi:hypothetical protein
MQTIKKSKDCAGVKIFGLSVFADQRPKHGITVGASGSHTVGVCIYHQNLKLMLSGIGLYDDLFQTFFGYQSWTSDGCYQLDFQ